jgi:hypothetical protein
MTWQPIETAPKDRPILSTNRHGVVAIIMWWPYATVRENPDAPIGERFSFVGAWDDGERPEDGSIDGYEPYEPRFWMPLPEPPEPQP